MTGPGCNVLVFLRDARGHVVPSSIRRGHNVFTRYGRTWMRDLVVWDTIAGSDVPLENKRLRDIVYGGGSQPATKDVLWVNSFIASYELAAQGDTTFPSSALCRIHHSIPVGDWNGTVFSEVGLRQWEGVTPATSMLCFYKTFEPILKTSGFSLETYWELKF